MKTGFQTRLVKVGINAHTGTLPSFVILNKCQAEEEIKGPKRGPERFMVTPSLTLLSCKHLGVDHTLASENNGNVVLHSSGVEGRCSGQSPGETQVQTGPPSSASSPGLGVHRVVGASFPQLLRQDVKLYRSMSLATASLATKTPLPPTVETGKRCGSRGLGRWKDKQMEHR